MGEGDHPRGGAVRRDDGAFKGDLEFLQGLAGGDKYGEVRVGAHNDGDYW